MSGNLQVWGADIFLLENWNAFSSQSDEDQLNEIFTRYIQLPLLDRHAYTERAKDGGLNKAVDLPQADQNLLNRLRTPMERKNVDMIWLRTCYGEGTDATFSAFIRARPDEETELFVFQDPARYNYGGGDGWRRIFTRLPQILDPYRIAPEKYETKKKEALDQCIEAERQDIADVEDQDGDPEEDGTYWMELYSAYHYKSKVGMILVADEETLRVENPASAKVLAVWFDEMGRVVRYTRLTAQETWNVEGLEMTMGGALAEHAEWTLAEAGEDYDWNGPLGPPFNSDDDEEEEGEDQ